MKINKCKVKKKQQLKENKKIFIVHKCQESYIKYMHIYL